MKNVILIFFLILPLLVISQTGPGGIGNSANNVLWLNASEDLTLAGSNIIDISDQSGNSNTATAPSVASRPLTIPNAVNGYSSMRFDGSNDYLTVSDNATIDLTQWNILVVTKATINKNFNAIYVKGSDAFENIEFLGFSDASFHLPIYMTNGVRNSPNSITGQYSTTDFDIFEYTFSSAVGRDVYKNFNNIITDNDTNTPQVNNNPLYIGHELGTSGRFLRGEIAELIFYNSTLSLAERIIINNYLSAKYDINLSTNDIYNEDDAVAGDFDHDVAGIGQATDGSNQAESIGTGIIRILNPANLDNNEFLIWGHDNQAIAANNMADVPTGVVSTRIDRTWRFSEADNTGSPVDVGAIDLQFDLSSIAPVVLADLSLLIDTNNDGSFTDEAPIFGATDLGGNIYSFTGVTGISDNARISIGVDRLSTVPTLNQWGLIILSLSILNLSMLMLMRNKREKTDLVIH